MNERREKSRPLRPTSLSYALRALGKGELPSSFTVSAGTFQLEQTIKHDFYAATGFYVDSEGRRAVLKVGRVVDFGGVSLRWLGRFLCRREMRFYRRLQDLPNIPRLLGQVGETGFAHEYVSGRPLCKDRPVPDGFFEQLRELLAELHRRGIAYVDTNKPENILLGDDGRPHLIDFQISLDLQEIGNHPLSRWILRKCQAEDFYHLLKHKRRFRPDELTPRECIDVERRSWIIRTHRFITKPYFKFRRGTFRRLRATGRLLPEGSK